MLKFILSLILGKERDMAIVYATLIIKGKKTFNQVPVKIRDAVKEALIDLECEYLITDNGNS